MKIEENVKKIIDLLEELNKLDIVKNSFAYDEFIKVSERLKDNRFKLAVVGEFSSGKSTFLNCLLKKDLLKHGRSETTATITEIENVRDNSDSGFFDVYYLNGKKESHISLDQLENYTSTSSNKHNVALEIERVVIKCKLFNTKEEITFVDTPGLNGVADKHREKTIEEIKKAHACIYLLPVRGLGKTDFEFLNFISEYQKNIIFVQNFIDELDELEQETPEQKIAEQKKLLEEQQLFDETNIIRFTAISSLKALVSLDKQTFDKYDNKELDDSCRKKLLKESRIESVLKTLEEIIEINKKESLQKKEAVLIALRILDELTDIVKFQKEQIDDEWNNSIDARRHLILKKKNEYLKDHKKEYISSINNFIDVQTEDTRRLGFKEIEEKLDHITDKVQELLDLEKTIDGLKSILDGPKINNLINSYIQKVEQNNEDLCTLRFENTIRSAVLRIQEFTSNKIEHIDSIKVDSAKSVDTIEFKSFDAEEEEINRTREKLKQKELELETIKDRQDSFSTKRNELHRKIELNSEEFSELSQKKQSEISSLGAQPDVEIKTKYVNKTVERKGGIFGKIVSFFIGEKIITVPESYKDFSKQNAWMRSRSEIDTKYAERQINLKNQKNRLEMELKRIENDNKDSYTISKEKQKEIETIQNLLNSKMELLKVEKEKAKNEYMNTLKHEVIIQLKTYLFDDLDIISKLKDRFKEACESNKEKVRHICLSLFETSYSLRIKEIEDLINSDLHDRNNDNLKIIIEKLQKSKIIMEDFIYGKC